MIRLFCIFCSRLHRFSPPKIARLPSFLLVSVSNSVGLIVCPLLMGCKGKEIDTVVVANTGKVVRSDPKTRHFSIKPRTSAASFTAHLSQMVVDIAEVEWSKEKVYSRICLGPV